MSSVEMLLMVLLVVVVLILLLQVAALWRGRGDAGASAKLDALKEDGVRLERALREEQRGGREELQQSFERVRGHLREVRAYRRGPDRDDVD